MKWLVLATILVTRATAAQLPPAPPNVPSGVAQAWQSRFPAVKTVEWKIKTDKNYEAEFKWHGADVAAKFAPFRCVRLTRGLSIRASGELSGVDEANISHLEENNPPVYPSVATKVWKALGL